MIKKSIVILAIALNHCWSFSGSAAYQEFYIAFGAINAGTAGALSTTSISSNNIDCNPAMIPFGKGIHVNYSSQPFFDYIHNYQSLSFTYKKYGFGLSTRRFYSNNEHDNPITYRSTVMSYSFSIYLSPVSSVGINIKSFNRDLADHRSPIKGNNYAFGVGIIWKEILTQFTYKNNHKFGNILAGSIASSKFIRDPRINDGITFGLSIRNLGPHVYYLDPVISDPLPQTFHFGSSYIPIKTNIFTINIGYEFERDLVSSYPDMDWDGDGYIGGYDENGHLSINNSDYNKAGQKEAAHTDNWYKAIFSSWVNDWLVGGDIDKAIPGRVSDHIIGGYDWYADSNFNGQSEPNEMIKSTGTYGDNNWGIYNEFGQVEVGNSSDRTFIDEWKTTTHNFGLSISLFGLVGYQVGRKSNIAENRDTRTWGYYLGPHFLRYYYAELKDVYNKYSYTHKFYTIEMNLTGDILKSIKNVLH
ncbi:MAG: hypothetical protein HQ562_08405 [Candidatus Marinimicrobia bacterium]|nr:hypothetical protein [Candidatus Neomarinimicrobiota bacterium]